MPVTGPLNWLGETAPVVCICKEWQGTDDAIHGTDVTKHGANGT